MYLLVQQSAADRNKCSASSAQLVVARERSRESQIDTGRATMECSRIRVATAIVFALLFLSAFEAGFVSCDPSSSAAVRLPTTVHIRKMLNATGDSRGGAAAYAAVRTMAADGCSEELVQVSQDNGGPLPSGIPFYSVTITNRCLSCTVRDVHVSCGEFASTELVNPSDFRRVGYGDCLVRDGGRMAPGDTVSFEYSNSFVYPMDVASVSCGNS